LRLNLKRAGLGAARFFHELTGFRGLPPAQRSGCVQSSAMNGNAAARNHRREQPCDFGDIERVFPATPGWPVRYGALSLPVDSPGYELSLFFQKAGQIFTAKAGVFFARRVLLANRFDLIETSMAVCRGIRAVHGYVG
jgi:hypothetical protein